ncbi:MAG: hypothetical protein D8M59_05080 [Planctomycetes bacterium]|nr:hypothetical protein [Planctomycetota bacterium]
MRRSSGRHPAGLAVGQAVAGLLLLAVGVAAVAFIGVRILGTDHIAAPDETQAVAAVTNTTTPEVATADEPRVPPLSAADTPSSHDPHAFVKGMTISCQSWGWEWGTDDMVQSMEDLRALGVNWIAIHPYASIRDDGTVSWRYGRRGQEVPEGEVPTWLQRPIDEAHDLGMKIMIKPHLAYWGSGFSWRGDIRFETQEQWERFFETYGTWVAQLAGICKSADAFVVGTELDATLAGHDAQWREVVAQVRGQYPTGVLTYAANWNTYDTVPFWDVLDVIGIQAYFPLVDMPAGVEVPGLVEHWQARSATVPDIEKYAEPTPEQMAAAWKRIMNDLHTASAKYGKPIVFTELGYNCSILAPYIPWDARMIGMSDGDGQQEEEGAQVNPAERVQRMCMAAALDAIEQHHDVIRGAFLWKWFPGSRPHGDFAMASDAMKNVIKEEWGE